MSFVDRTQQYRHGVLIGNWNEDAFGIDRVNSPASLTSLPPQEHFRSVAQASFRPYDAAVFESSEKSKLSTVDRRAGVGRSLLEQPGADAQQAFSTTYGIFGRGQPGSIKPDYSLSKPVGV